MGNTKSCILCYNRTTTKRFHITINTTKWWSRSIRYIIIINRTKTYLSYNLRINIIKYKSIIISIITNKCSRIILRFHCSICFTIINLYIRTLLYTRNEWTNILITLYITIKLTILKINFRIIINLINESTYIIICSTYISINNFRISYFNISIIIYNINKSTYILFSLYLLWCYINIIY